MDAYLQHSRLSATFNQFGKLSVRPLLYGFLITQMEGECGERTIESWWRDEEPAAIFIHYQSFFVPIVPWRKHLLASHSLPPLPLSHCSFIPPLQELLSLDPTELPHEQVFSVNQSIPLTNSGEGETQREETDQEAKVGPRMGRGRLRGLALGAPPAGVTLHPALSRCLIPSLLIYHVWTYSCSSGLDSKQIAGAEGL